MLHFGGLWDVGFQIWSFSTRFGTRSSRPDTRHSSSCLSFSLISFPLFFFSFLSLVRSKVRWWAPACVWCSPQGNFVSPSLLVFLLLCPTNFLVVFLFFFSIFLFFLLHEYASYMAWHPLVINTAIQASPPGS